VAQLLADLDDIKRWLPDDKLLVTDGSTSSFQVEAYRIVKSQLAGVFTPVTLNEWADPSSTPGIIRSVAGRLIAAYVYREAYSEDIPDIPEYAQALYDEAILLLTQIRTGTLTVVDEDDNPIGDNILDISASDFYPNNSAPGPYFSMEQEFA
jgi:hypothetical protein